MSNRLAGHEVKVRLLGRAIPGRALVVAAAAVVWLATILLATGSSAVPAAAVALLLLLPLTVVSLLVRSVTFRLQFAFALWGGCMVAAAILAIGLFQTIDSARDTLRHVAVPFLEESLKLLPLMAFLWLRRANRGWSVGATDVLVLAASTGATFGFVEDSYLRHAGTWEEGLWWLPVTSAVDGGARLVAGHAIWSAIAGGGIGLALLFRARPRIAVALALAGFTWSWLDHFANNQIVGAGSDGGGILVDIWRTVEGNGFFTAYLMLALVVTCVVADRVALRNQVHIALPARAPGGSLWNRLNESWAPLRTRRALAFAGWQVRRFDEVGLAVPATLEPIRQMLRSSEPSGRSSPRAGAAAGNAGPTHPGPDPLENVQASQSAVAVPVAEADDSPAAANHPAQGNY